MSQYTDLEKRMINTEQAFLALYIMTKGKIPVKRKAAVENMMNQYLHANKRLGAEFSPGFLT